MQVDTQAADTKQLVSPFRMAHNWGWKYWSNN